jgi:hypothetical protein
MYLGISIGVLLVLILSYCEELRYPDEHRYIRLWTEHTL